MNEVMNYVMNDNLDQVGPREKQIIDLLLQGCDNAEIARDLNMAEQPQMRAPVSGLLAPYLRRKAMRPGISFSASSISLRPQSARDMSATLYGNFVST